MGVGLRRDRRALPLIPEGTETGRAFKRKGYLCDVSVGVPALVPCGVRDLDLAEFEDPL